MGLAGQRLFGRGFSILDLCGCFSLIVFLFFKLLCLTLAGKGTSLGKTKFGIRRINGVHLFWNGYVGACT